MNIKKKIQKILGKKIVIEPIADTNIYKSIEKSYTGGSLTDINILIVTNTEIEQEVIHNLQTNENVSVAVINKTGKLVKDDIIDAGKDLIGPFFHIINIYKKDGSSTMLNQVNAYPETDEMYQLYQWLQEEVDYLVPFDKYATLCSVYISDGSQFSKAVERSADLCIRGLGEAMANHSVINNGIIADSSVSISEIINAASYMSSKYGQILAGEVLHLKD